MNKSETFTVTPLIYELALNVRPRNVEYFGCLLMRFINIPHLVESPVSCRIYWGKVREVLDIPLPDEPVKDSQQYSVLS